MNENGRQKGFVLGEPVRNKATGQKMYVDLAWTPTVRCVYFDPEKETLVKVQMLPEELERIKDLLPYLPK
ncbi:hypothetical protein FH587_20105 [Leptospira interrogans]|uniref:hypothetical protein n=1 Tax=Leptospira interrogans TaxID=173 RepID=UPI001F08772F|nr:hypothetical protein [Leptospira interrogans]UML84278.1 hypothetical protein FH587_20025 [Leptospira interrogans]UML84294.1 hypothetical protein FH587_20105 [Leptospira interrogans]